MLTNLLAFSRRLLCKVEKSDRVCFAYNPYHTIYIREYYFLCVELLKKCFRDIDAPINVIFGDYAISFGNSNRTARIDIQFEHTLVKPGGRDSAGAVAGKIPIGDGPGFYLVRIQNYDRLNAMDLIIEYSIPNLINVSESGAFAGYLGRTVHLSPLIYDVDFGSNRRGGEVITLFADASQPRRKAFLDRIRGSGLPLRNVKRTFGKDKLARLYGKTRILVNVHQTDHHHTFEELRVLPALLCGVIIVSEDVPLKEHIPYHRFVIWSSYENIVDTVRLVYDDYDRYYKTIFDDPELVEVLTGMKKHNSDNACAAVHRVLGESTGAPAERP